MRMFDLFLRRAGVDRAQSQSRRRSVSRLTVECPREMVGSLRRQICLDFRAAGIDVSEVSVDAGARPELASTCITVSCPTERRGDLMDQARRLSSNPDVHRVRFGRTRAQPELEPVVST